MERTVFLRRQRLDIFQSSPQAINWPRFFNIVTRLGAHLAVLIALLIGIARIFA